MGIGSGARALLAGLFFSTTSCASSPHDASRAPASDTSEPSSSAASSNTAADVAPPPTATAVAVPSSEPPPTATAVAELAPYPADAIRRGQTDAEKRCLNLVYKNGCSELRTGELSMRVTLRDDGSVISTHTAKNTITKDPNVVEQCVLDAVTKFRFDAPQAGASSFTMKLVFGDRC